MAEITRHNPQGIDASRDYPRSPARIDVPMWNENCLFYGYDPDSGIFFYLHHGRLAADTSLWCGDFWIALPDGRLLVSKTYGKNGLLRGMDNGSLRFECIEPLSSWRITFDGAAFLTTREDNARCFASVDLIPMPVEFDVIWESTAPFVSMNLSSIADPTVLADSEHYEQGGVFRGHIRIGKELIAIRGPGYRDHSVGPRDGSKGANSHVWANATFPKSGRVFALAGLNDGNFHAYAVINGTYHKAEVLRAPSWPKGMRNFEASTFELSLRVDGEEIIVSGEVIPTGLFWTLVDPAQFCPGRDRDRELIDHHWVVLETVAKYTWDGEVSYGVLEISRRQGDYPET